MLTGKFDPPFFQKDPAVGYGLVWSGLERISVRAWVPKDLLVAQCARQEYPPMQRRTVIVPALSSSP